MTRKNPERIQGQYLSLTVPFFEMEEWNGCMVYITKAWTRKEEEAESLRLN
jgi:hypothetical protein